MLFKLSLIISFVVYSTSGISQQKQSIIFQFGGQTIVSAHYERELLNTDIFHLNFNAGFGLNENGDEQTGKSAVYALHTGLVGLFGKNKLYLESSLFPSTYFNGSVTFINLNGWVGLKYDPFYNSNGPFISVGYTPRIYSSYNGTDYLNIPFAVKLGVNF